MKLYRDKNGKKLYPVCRWEPNQHKIYNAYDKAIIRRDEENTDTAFEWAETVEKALESFDRHIIDGFVYATYEDGQIIKDIITAYDVRTDQLNYSR